jgi:serine/threonine protein kinase
MAAATVCMQVDDYIVYKAARIGTGLFCNVYRARKVDTNVTVVARVTKPTTTPDQYELSVSEVHVLRKLGGHTGIILLLHSCVETARVTTFFPYATHGTLEKWFANYKRGVPLSEPEVRGIMRTLCGAVMRAHCLGVAHCDLKLANVLLFVDTDALVGINGGGNAVPLCCKLSDWNLSCPNNPTRMAKARGTPEYAAPELMAEPRLGVEVQYNGVRADVWSLGVVAYILLTGRHPIEPEVDYSPDRTSGLSADDFIYRLTRPEFKIDFVLSGRTDLTTVARHMLQEMLTRCPAQRITIKNLIEHPWFSDRFASAPIFYSEP